MTSTSYPANAQDWRGRFIFDMAAALARREELHLSLWAPPGVLPHRVENALLHGDAEWLADLLRKGGIAHLLRTRKFAGIMAGIGLLRRQHRAYRCEPADVAHVNWLQNALALWGTSMPAVITVLGTDFKLLSLPGMRHALRRILANRRAVLAPNAGWMAPVLEREFGDVAMIHPVPFGVEASWFGVKRQADAGSPAHWLAVTRLTRNKLGDLFGWGEGLFDEQRILHLFGPMQENIVLPAWVKYHGPTHPTELREQWFPKAAGLITLSRHDEGRPQVILEAMAAGLPVIASDLPAHRDIVRHQETGWLATSREDLHEALTWLDTAESNQLVGKAAQNWVRNNIGTWDDCAARYTALYRTVLEKRG